MKVIFIFGSIVCLLLMYSIAKTTSAGTYDILYLPFSYDILDLKALVLSVPVELNVLGKLIRIYCIDMFFVIFYTGVLAIWTHDEMNRNRDRYMNYILRLNLVLIVLTGLSDSIENVIMWYNFEVFGSNSGYISVRQFALIKYILASWVISSLITSKLMRILGFNALIETGSK